MSSSNWNIINEWIKGKNEKEVLNKISKLNLVEQVEYLNTIVSHKSSVSINILKTCEQLLIKKTSELLKLNAQIQLDQMNYSAAFEKYVESGMKPKEAWIFIGKYLMDKNNYVDAYKAFKEAEELQLMKQAQEKIVLGVVDKIKDLDIDNAIKYLKDILKKERLLPERTASACKQILKEKYLEKGKQALNSKKFEDAKEFLLLAGTQETDMWSLMGEAYEKNELFDEAFKAYEKASNQKAIDNLNKNTRKHIEQRLNGMTLESQISYLRTLLYKERLLSKTVVKTIIEILKELTIKLATTSVANTKIDMYLGDASEYTVINEIYKEAKDILERKRLFDETEKKRFFLDQCLIHKFYYAAIVLSRELKDSNNFFLAAVQFYKSMETTTNEETLNNCKRIINIIKVILDKQEFSHPQMQNVIRIYKSLMLKICDKFITGPYDYSVLSKVEETLHYYELTNIDSKRYIYQKMLLFINVQSSEKDSSIITKITYIEKNLAHFNLSKKEFYDLTEQLIKLYPKILKKHEEHNKSLKNVENEIRQRELRWEGSRESYFHYNRAYYNNSEDAKRDYYDNYSKKRDKCSDLITKHKDIETEIIKLLIKLLKDHGVLSTINILSNSSQNNISSEQKLAFLKELYQETEDVNVTETLIKESNSINDPKIKLFLGDIYFKTNNLIKAEECYLDIKNQEGLNKIGDKYFEKKIVSITQGLEKRLEEYKEQYTYMIEKYGTSSISGKYTLVLLEKYLENNKLTNEYRGAFSEFNKLIDHVIQTYDLKKEILNILEKHFLALEIYGDIRMNNLKEEFKRIYELYLTLNDTKGLVIFLDKVLNLDAKKSEILKEDIPKLFERINEWQKAGDLYNAIGRGMDAKRCWDKKK